MIKNNIRILSHKRATILFVVIIILAIFGVVGIVGYKYFNDVYEPSSSTAFTVSDRHSYTYYPSDIQRITTNYSFTLQPANISVRETMRDLPNPFDWNNDN
jgi:nitrate/TMAO reductase-like tetraheme cytochrome c subunit